MTEPRLTHLRADGSAHMVDVSAKDVTVRSATAIGRVLLSPAAVAALRAGTVPKGDALSVARIAGIQAAKRTPDLIPLAHPINVHAVGQDKRTGESAKDAAGFKNLHRCSGSRQEIPQRDAHDPAAHDANPSPWDHERL